MILSPAVQELLRWATVPEQSSEKWWGCCAPFRGELGSHLTQCCLGRGLPLYQVASLSIQPFGHNRRGAKMGTAVPLSVKGAGSPSNTMWPEPRPTSIPSGCPFSCLELPLSVPGDLDLHLIHGSLGSPVCSTQTASRSVQPFFARLTTMTDR